MRFNLYQIHVYVYIYRWVELHYCIHTQEKKNDKNYDYDSMNYYTFVLKTHSLQVSSE